jgi:hypothetical protein
MLGWWNFNNNKFGLFMIEALKMAEKLNLTVFSNSSNFQRSFKRSSNLKAHAVQRHSLHKIPFKKAIISQSPSARSFSVISPATRDIPRKIPHHDKQSTLIPLTFMLPAAIHKNPPRPEKSI